MRSLALITASYLPAIVAAAGPPNFTFDTLWSLQTNFWDNFLYPANLKQINTTDDSIFAKDVQGRVDTTRTFPGRELNNEYIFGLFSQPETFSLTGIPIAYNITQFVASQNIASATTVITFNSTSLDILLPLTIDTWIAFNADGKIIQYDAVFRWFGWLVQVLPETAGKFGTKDPAEVQSKLTTLLAEGVCEMSDKYCTGENLQYESKEQCKQFLTKETRFGMPHELGKNTLFCREVHKHMVQYRPKEHCSHIGPSGGNMCVDDKSYAETVMEAYYPQSWVAYGYGDDNMWVLKH
ncbi:hypothetical protein BDV28DRAFT_163146 [Aspergillus coremiiformis]|uniref:Uncharacterized protein n=1 Tax=Aspergillus coremiiformis TaxID=138285 RepID=A0A5N6ZF15_9EURO|nr:hypothetical protein BDV28DRAFT_163146 [Aspergillus coremiiformis]